MRQCDRNEIKAVIITAHTLMALGLKQLMHDALGIDAHIVNAPTSPLLDSADLFLCDAQTFVSSLDFFLPRKEKTLVISHGRHARGGAPHHINPYGKPAEIVDEINRFIHKEVLPKQNSATLSQREIDVLRLVVAGRTSKEIAEALHISVNTVMTHRKNISSKLGIKSVSGLSFYALMNGLTTDDTSAS